MLSKPDHRPGPGAAVGRLLSAYNLRHVHDCVWKSAAGVKIPRQDCKAEMAIA